MKVLGWIIGSAGGLSLLFGIGMGLALVFGGSGFDVWTFLGLFLFSFVPTAAGAGLVFWGRHFLRQGEREQALRFERALRDLAQKTGGSFTLEQVSRELGCARDEAERLLRPLVAREVLEMDFLQDGEMSFKLTPMAESRALLGR